MHKSSHRHHLCNAAPPSLWTLPRYFASKFLFVPGNINPCLFNQQNTVWISICLPIHSLVSHSSYGMSPTEKDKGEVEESESFLQFAIRKLIQKKKRGREGLKISQEYTDQPVVITLCILQHWYFLSDAIPAVSLSLVDLQILSCWHGNIIKDQYFWISGIRADKKHPKPGGGRPDIHCQFSQVLGFLPSVFHHLPCFQISKSKEDYDCCEDCHLQPCHTCFANTVWSFFIMKGNWNNSNSISTTF